MREVLVVDDEAEVRSEVRGLLEDAGFAVREAGDEEEALAEVARRRPTLVLLDIWLGSDPQGGLRILERFRGQDLRIPVVMFSGHGTIETAVNSIKLGALDFVEKPFRGDQLLHVIRRTLESQALRRENSELRRRAARSGELIGSSPAMRELRESVQRAAASGSRVLLLGPPGSGKEVAARLLHRLSTRSEAPFLALNCALLHPDRLEAELFGLTGGEGGARAGVLEQAHGGTLLLDEVADMPLETQGKILRVLQEQRFHRLGGGPAVEVDVRILASSARELEEEVKRSTFREELFYRLNIVVLRVPPLARRSADVPELAGHFLARAAADLGLAPRRLAPRTLALLEGCDWPGNVRQLRNVIDNLLIMTPGGSEDPIGPEALPEEIRGGEAEPAGGGFGADFLSLPLREARESFEREYLSRQLRRFDGRIARAAEEVGMERSALYRKLRSLHLVEGGAQRGAGASGRTAGGSGSGGKGAGSEAGGGGETGGGAGAAAGEGPGAEAGEGPGAGGNGAGERAGAQTAPGGGAGGPPAPAS